MKKIIILLSCLIFAYTAFAQKDCSVIFPQGVDNYEGKCRGGLAHGKGVAEGKDVYKGQFRKGLPDGKGTCVWENGDKYEGEWQKGKRHGKGTFSFKVAEQDSILEGMWENNEYLGPILPKPRIIQKINVDRYSVQKIGKGTGLTVILMQNGSTNVRVTDLLIEVDSGNQGTNFMPIRYDNIEFPFTAKIRYNTPNKLGSADVAVNFEVKVSEPGEWKIVLHN